MGGDWEQTAGRARLFTTQELQQGDERFHLSHIVCYEVVIFLATLAAWVEEWQR